MTDLGVLNNLYKVAESYPVKQQIMKQMVIDMRPYVPIRSGKLRKNVTISPNGITYKMKYAHYQYYGHFKHSNPDGGSIVPTFKWDQSAKQACMDKWIEVGTKAILKEAKK